MNHNMGSTLSHFSIQMGGPSVRLLLHDQVCFYLAISLGIDSTQDRASINAFCDILEKATSTAGTNIQDGATAVLSQASSKRCLLVLDALLSDVADDQKTALIQLGYHLAGAYFTYCDRNDR